MSGWGWSYFFSREFLGSRPMLWMLFWVNFLGTIYGYIWYGNQLKYTVEHMSPLYLPFVPDSPTASLFFTWFLLIMLIGRKDVDRKTSSGFRGFVEAFAVITSFKYGIWAVAMIMAGAYQGDLLVWQDWMLTISHLGMAAEALLYYRFYRFRWMAVLIVACWVLLNDAMDYAVGVYPWLPKVLEDDLAQIASFTILLSWASIAVALLLWWLRVRKERS
ncbi:MULTISPECIES: DUF1405 domain-containing protein [unclassified Paenibacillus]|uniref:DUF1405 domain-containing protein n=1 Tax=unclassified Paenibacillus TaxID=185978 RepID=UPI001B6F01D1|nr:MULTISPECIES: DUF1405 domain-containing protein [unclassified Paenibacillus]MBP1155287.1 putative membrane protein YpjA [Paenibacillus sp. PvP091]MBP1169329.1 putative membrane protein YpjA [Paenibacillus sp. PvR098]MBP2440357.1 putative membrane protein YpjA [Paenibacillus sp. PvP052]